MGEPSLTFLCVGSIVQFRRALVEFGRAMLQYGRVLGNMVEYGRVQNMVLW